jgi:hypothetical protein
MTINCTFITVTVAASWGCSLFGVTAEGYVFVAVLPDGLACAVMASLWARGELAVGTDFIHEVQTPHS